MSKLDEAEQEWFKMDEGEGLNPKLMSVANAVFWEKPECRTEDAIEDYLLDMGTRRWGNLDDRYKQDCRRAAERTVEKMSNSGANGKPRNTTIQRFETVKVDKKKLAEFHKKLMGDGWKAKIQGWKQGDATTKDIFFSLFRNAGDGYVAYYGNKTDTQWATVADGFAKYDGLGKYYTLCTFRENTKRNSENMAKQAVMVMEIDSPHDWADGEKEQMTDEEKKKLRESNMEDTCRLLEALGIEPTTITFSGNKSWHVAFRLKHPVDKVVFAKDSGLIADAYKVLGADGSMSSVVRASRIPCVSPSSLSESEKSERQHVVYWNENAEVDYEEFKEKVVELAEKVNGGKLRNMPDLSKCCVFTTVSTVNDKGETEKKTVWKPRNWEPMIRELGVFKMHRDGNEVYIYQDKDGLYSELSLDEVGDYVLNAVGRYNMGYKSDLRDKRDTAQPKWYRGINGTLNPLKDSKDCVTIPFKGGLVRITAEGISLSCGYGGYSIPRNTPSINHEFEVTSERSEFEVFLRHACGELENNPEWKKRYKAFCCLAGYLVSGRKESVNHMCVLLDESVTENSGGTGKSLFMSGIAKVVETDYRDERRKTKDAVRFEDSDYSPTTRVQWKDEIPQNYDWPQDFGPASGGKKIEQKGKNKRIKLDLEQMPKLVYCTNYFPSGTTAHSIKRRMKYFELSDHYHDISPEDEFGHLMFTDWDKAEWNRFYNFICGCVQYYIQCGKLIESGSRFEAEKTENANVNVLFIDWYERVIADVVETKGEFVILQRDVLSNYSDWVKEKYKKITDPLPKKRKVEWLRILSKGRGIDMKECTQWVVNKNDKAWKFTKDRTQSIDDVEVRRSENKGAECENGGNSTKTTSAPKNEDHKVREKCSSGADVNNVFPDINTLPHLPHLKIQDCKEKKEEDNYRETSDFKGAEVRMEDLGAFAPDLDEYGCDINGHIPKTRGWYDMENKKVYFVDSIPKPKEFPPYDRHCSPTYHWTFDGVALDIRMVICGNVSGYVVENGKTRRVTDEEIQRSKEL